LAESVEEPAGAPEPRARRRLAGRKGSVLLAIAAAGAVGIALASRSGQARSWAGMLGSSPSAGASVHRVAKTRLTVKVAAPGILESSRSREVVNEVEGQSTILFLAPEGSIVRKGELLCELDSSALRDSLTNQVIATRLAESDLQTAIKTREVAEFALREYVGGTYPQDMQNAEIARTLAETNLKQAADRLDWSTRMVQKGFLPRAQVLADQDSKNNCEIALENARTKIRVLATYTRRKTLSELRADIQKARGDELAKLATLGLEQTKQRKLEAQVAKCKMYAPTTGLVTYVNDDMMRPGSNQVTIQEGATVRERQAIVRMPDIAHMRVSTKIDESQISRVAPGKRAWVRVDALPGQLLEGTVGRVQQIADPAMPPMIEIRTYTVLIDIDKPPLTLRPAMSARVEILASQTGDVLAVPVEAVLQSQGQSAVLVSSPAGPALREVELGTSDDHLIEVVAGLREGDEVALDPQALMTDEARRKALIEGEFTLRPDGAGGGLASTRPGSGSGDLSRRGGTDPAGGGPNGG
jgi:multidrug efflux pump subunit AcrA (membrane-fusion protein)